MISCDVEPLTADARAHDLHRVAHRLKPDLLFLVGDDQPPHALVAGRNHAPEGDVVADERLQLERDVLQHVREVRPFVEPLDESAGLPRVHVCASSVGSAPVSRSVNPGTSAEVTSSSAPSEHRRR